MYIKNVSSEKVIEVKAFKDPFTNKVTYENLPPEVEVNIYHYTQEERWENFRYVMMCLLTLHASLNNNMLSDSNYLRASSDASILPSTTEYEKMLTDFATFCKDDPSEKYDISNQQRIGVGGFAKVFRVIRRTDQKLCALKFIETKTKKEFDMMRNEVALMNKFRDDEIVLEIFD